MNHMFYNAKAFNRRKTSIPCQLHY
jgi:hypothetical protein